MKYTLQIPTFHVPGFTDSGFSCSGFYRFRLFMFRVLQIPAFHVSGLKIAAFHVPGFTDSGFSCSGFYRFRLLDVFGLADSMENDQNLVYMMILKSNLFEVRLVIMKITCRGKQTIPSYQQTKLVVDGD